MNYAMCITAKYGRKTVFSLVRAVSLNSSFQDIFKERLETARKGDDFPKEDCDTEFILGSVPVSAGSNGPWHTVEFILILRIKKKNKQKQKQKTKNDRPTLPFFFGLRATQQFLFWPNLLF